MSLLIHCDSFKTTKEANLSLTEEEAELQQFGGVFCENKSVSPGKLILDNKTEV